MNTAPDGDPKDQIAACEREVERLRSALAVHQSQESRPSFHRLLVLLGQMNNLMPKSDVDRTHSAWHLSNKLRMYDFARSHGVSTPRVLNRWSRIEDIDLESLPTEFVLKSTGGSTGHGVIPLRRSAGAYEVVGEGATLSAAAILDRVRDARDRKRTYGTYFAEELLASSASPDSIPDDVKIYCFYGRPGQVLLRRVQSVNDQESVLSKYLDPEGNDLGDVTSSRRLAADITTPDEITKMVEIAAHLSREIGLPFCRVDLYGIDGDVKLGEITRAPGGEQQYTSAHDEMLGSAWLDAQLRLDIDLINGRRPGILFGPHVAAPLATSEAWARLIESNRHSCPTCQD